MNTLIPLRKSHSHNTYEDELKQLFIRLWQNHLSGKARDVNVSYTPHLGSKTLLNRYLVSQDISNFNVASLNDDEMRYLSMAWKYRNGKRGTHFLHTYIKCLWGVDFEILPLWQKKSGTYPQELKTEQEITEHNEHLADYFLTSRLRIVLYGDNGYFSTEIARSLNKLLPARLFVQEVNRSIDATTQLFWAVYSYIESTHDTENTTISEEINSDVAHFWATDTTFHSITSKD